MTEIAIIGLGAMGSRMAERLLHAGHTVLVNSRARARAAGLEAAGATWVGSPREAAARAEIVLSMVTDDAASQQVWQDEARGALGGLRAGSFAVESSTLSPAWVETLGAAVEQRGATFVSAPVVGSRPQAEAGQLVVLAGGPEAAVRTLEPVLKAMASAVHRVGSPAAAAMLKLGVNALFATQVVAWAEVLGTLARAGLPSSEVAELLLGTPVASPALRGAAASIVGRRFEPRFPIALVHKDLGYFTEAAGAVEAVVPATAAVRDAYGQARAEGHGEDDLTGIAQLVG